MAAEPERAGTADAAVRLLQPGAGARGRGRALVGAALALPGDRLPVSLARGRALRGRARSRRGARRRTGASPTTSSSPTTTLSSGTSERRDRPATSRARRSRAEIRSSHPAAVTIRIRRSRSRRTARTSPPPARSSGCTRSPSRRRSPRGRGRIPTETTGAAASTAASARGSAARSMRRRARSTPICRSRSNSKQLRGARARQGAADRDGQERPRDGRHVCRRAWQRALPAGRRGRSSRRSRSRTTGYCCSRRSKAHPNGIGNDRGRVGKNYTYQIYPAPVTGLWAGKKLNMYMGNTCTIKIIYDYNADNFDHSDLHVHRRLAALLRALRTRARQLGRETRRTRRAARGVPSGRSQIRTELGLAGVDRHRGREPALPRSVRRPRPELHATNGASRSFGSASTGTTTSVTCGGSSLNEHSRSCRR